MMVFAECSCFLHPFQQDNHDLDVLFVFKPYAGGGLIRPIQNDAKI